ncbi:hypothetical protein I302_103145 [Kwoniella bestiolae CBS 10118]|uniref:Apple domain-containing protein n=1 Tax=Kwoniella bestiolae CBS 10118 TaxID=1296100 RepID=A0A1B9G7K3_9TREE|nr:hypothetical protein I302_01844 [Kwoniella bestiolae CBS 10118]OCF27009.1 hypothetical protein I302_01844 [Kwoniella bestiolae CBS 10118]
MRPLSLVFLTAAIISVSPIAWAQNIPRGFLGWHTLQSDGLPVYSLPSNENLPSATRDQCIANCLQTDPDYQYAFFWNTLDPHDSSKTIPHCRCWRYPASDAYVSGDPIGGCDLQGVGHSYAELATQPKYIFTGCWSALSPTAPQPFTVYSFLQCLGICQQRVTAKTLKYAVVQSDPIGQWYCRCSNSESDFLPYPRSVMANCEERRFYIYKWPQSVGPSQAARKRKTRGTSRR